MTRFLSLTLSGLVLAAGNVPATAQDSRYEYRALFICGKAPAGSSYAPGQYKTTLNVYNSEDRVVSIRYHAVSATTSDDKKSPTVISTLPDVKPSGFYELGCDKLNRDTTVPFANGYVILDTDARIEVTSFLAGLNATGEQLTNVAIDRVPARFISVDPGLCTRGFTVDLSRFRHWRTAAGKRVEGVRGVYEKEFVAGNKERGWMSHTFKATPSPTPQVYELKYCSCSGSARIQGDLKSEAKSTGQSFPGAKTIWEKPGKWKKGESEALNESFEPAANVTNILRVSVEKGVTTTGISFNAKLVLDEGHLGECKPRSASAER